MMVGFLRDQVGLRWMVAIIGMLGTILLCLGAGTMIYLAYFDTAPPFTSSYVYFTDQDGMPLTQLHPGQTVLVHRDLCFNRDAPVTMGRYLVSTDGPEPLNVHVNSTNGMLRKGCVPNANAIRIPEFTPPWRNYRYSVIVQYSNNFLHNGVAELPAPIVEIVP